MKRRWNTLKEHIRYQLDKSEDEIRIIIGFIAATVILIAAAIAVF